VKHFTKEAESPVEQGFRETLKFLKLFHENTSNTLICESKPLDDGLSPSDLPSYPQADVRFDPRPDSSSSYNEDQRPPLPQVAATELTITHADQVDRDVDAAVSKRATAEACLVAHGGGRQFSWACEQRASCCSPERKSATTIARPRIPDFC
jgi:hypothetical protein